MPAGGIMRQVVGEVGQSKSKGVAYKKEIQTKIDSAFNRQDKKEKI